MVAPLFGSGKPILAGCCEMRCANVGPSPQTPDPETLVHCEILRDLSGAESALCDHVWQTVPDNHLDANICSNSNLELKVNLLG